nr:NERD domain-containing protein [uncultured Romboutsia sp.]
MGKIYPENLDNLCNMQKGEYTFYQILSKYLNDDYIALYDTELNAVKCEYNDSKEYNPDFVIISKYGVLVVEIKDWNIGYMKKFSHDSGILLIDKDVETNPYRQAKDYSRYLINTLNFNSEFKKLNIRWDRVVVFPNISKKDFISKGFDESKHLSTDYLFLEDINNLKMSNNYDDLDTIIKNCFTYKTTKYLTNEVICNIYKFIVNEIKFEHSFSNLLASLYNNQREKVEKWHNNSQILLRGVSGSGKTVLLKSRAHYFADQNKDEEILFLTHTNKLKDYIYDDLKLHKNIHVSTKSSFLINLSHITNLNFDIGNLNDISNINLLKNRILSSSKCPKYKAIFIDEVQDFKKEELILVKSLLKNPELSHFIIALDAIQNIYGNNYSLEGIVKQVDTLYKNYRNTKNIAQFSYDECDLSKCNQLTFSDFLNSEINTSDYYDCYRNIEFLNVTGIDVTKKRINYNSIINFIDNELRKLDIDDNYAILTAQNKVVEDLKDKIKKCKNCIIDYNKVYTVHTVKGLEFKLVFLIDKDFFVKNIKTDQLKYVGCTRAQEILYMLKAH